MSDALDYLIARIDSLRLLVADVANALADSLDVTASPGGKGHSARLAAHRARSSKLRAKAPKQHPLSLLRKRHDLDDTDEDILLLSLACSLDRNFGQLLASLQRAFTSTHPTVDLTLSLLTTDFRMRLSTMRRFEPDGKMLVASLIHLSTPTMNPSLLAREVCISDRIQRELLYGDSAVHTIGDFATFTTPTRTFDDVHLPEVDLQRLLAVLNSRASLCKASGPAADFILITGASGTGKSVTAEACASHLGVKLMTINASSLSSQLARSRQALIQLVHEAASANALMFFDHCELLFGSRLQGNRDLPYMLEALSAADNTCPIVFATSMESTLDSMVHRRTLLRIALTNPPPTVREALWQYNLQSTGILLAEDVDMPFIAEKYDFNGGQLGSVARLVTAHALARAESTTPPTDPIITVDDLENASEARRQHHLAELAVHTVTHLGLSDLILPTPLMKVIHSILAAVRNRRRIFEEWGFGERLSTGRGLSMLFRGPSGTGKTLSAEIIAAELALPLYRVSIPRIVSKYIGETEQNLEKAFREAEVASAILLFDEADAIFTKRVEVSSSTDRHSNMEVNLLLQEMERFDGVVILTTNLDAAIDDAFERRLNYKLDFPFPDMLLRGQIWKRHLPANAPIELEDDDITYLAENFILSGGSIKNIVLRAAYAAAEQADPINIEHLESAAFQEYKELGKLIRTT